jgi:hypothetical protein
MKGRVHGTVVGKAQKVEVCPNAPRANRFWPHFDFRPAYLKMDLLKLRIQIGDKQSADAGQIGFLVRRLRLSLRQDGFRDSGLMPADFLPKNFHHL